MHFCLWNAAQTFQCFIDQALRDLDYVVAYIDDVLLASKTIEENKSYLQAIYECFQQYRITINPDNSITEFNLDAESGRTFESWFKKYEDMFQTDFAQFDDAWKVQLLLRKLGTAEHDRFTNFILPKLPRDLGFADAVKILAQIFGEQSSLFNIRYQCLKITKRDTEDFITYAGVVNRECERFQLSSMTEDQFKCLIFVAGLQSPHDADIRTRLLNRIEQDPELTLQKLTTECQHLINLKADAAMIGHSKLSQPDMVCKVTSKRKSSSKRTPRKPPTPCWFCEEWHYSRHCPYRNHRCSKCSRKGHKEECCRDNFRSSRKHRPDKRTQAEAVTATFRMKSPGRRKFVTLCINGTPVTLQLDTGSDLTLISKRTWNEIGRPPVEPTKCIVRNASGGSLKLTGKLNCSVTFKGIHLSGTCYLTNYTGLDLLGLDWINELQLLDEPLNAVCDETTANGPDTFTRTSRPDDFVVATVAAKPETRWSIRDTATIQLLASGSGSPLTSVQFGEPSQQPATFHPRSEPFSLQSQVQADRPTAIRKVKEVGPAEGTPQQSHRDQPPIQIYEECSPRWTQGRRCQTRGTRKNISTSASSEPTSGNRLRSGEGTTSHWKPDSRDIPPKWRVPDSRSACWQPQGRTDVRQNLHESSQWSSKQQSAGQLSEGGGVRGPAVPNNRTSHHLCACVTCRTRASRRHALIGQNASQSESSTLTRRFSPPHGHSGTTLWNTVTTLYIYSCERQPETDKNKTDPGNLGKSLDPVYQSVNPLMLVDKPIEMVDKFVYLGSRISPGGLTKDEISIRIGMARTTFANLWRRRDISFSVKGRVYNAAVRSILLYGSETWPLRAEDVKRLSVFDRRCLRSIARIWWDTGSAILNRALNGAHASKLLSSMHGSFSNPSLDSPLTVLDLCTNLSAPACNAQLPTHPPKPSVNETAAATTTAQRTVIPAFSTPTSHTMPIASHALQGLQERPLRPKSHVSHPSVPGQASTQAACLSASAAIPAVHLTAFNVCKQAGQQTALECTLDSFSVYVCCLYEARVQEPNMVIELTFPLFSDDPDTAASGSAPVGTALSHRDERSLFETSPVDNPSEVLRARGLVPTLVNSSGLSAPTNLYGLPTANHAYLTHPSAPRHPFSQMHGSMPRISVFNSLSPPTCIPAPLPTTSNNQPSNTVTATSFQSKPRTIRPNRPDLPPMAMNCGRLVPSRFPNPPKSLNAPILGSHQQTQIASGLPTPTLDATSPGLGVGEARLSLLTTSPEQLASLSYHIWACCEFHCLLSHSPLHATITSTTTTTTATAHAVTRIVSPVCSTSTSTAHTGPSLVNSGTSVQSAGGTVTTTTASPALGSVSFSGTNADSDGTDASALVPVAWGRVVRMADGALHFPGIGRQLFSNPQSVLQRIRAAASPDDSFSLQAFAKESRVSSSSSQLPPNSIDFDIPMEARTNNLMKRTSTDCGSRKGFHVCLCCQQTFTSPSLYDSHMLRPLARIFYRCHICRGSETAHLTSVEENPAVDLHMSVVDLLNSFGSDASSGPSAAISGGSVGPLTNTSAGTIQQQLPSHSPYCTVLFGGIVKAFNRCAVYSHFAHAHPNEVDLWTLQPSRISVCPLAESAWEPSTLELNGTDIVLATCVSGMNSTTHDGASLPQIPALPSTLSSRLPEPDTGRQPSSSPVSHPTSVSEPVNPVINDNLSEDGNRAAKKLDASFPYRPGVELAEVWNDLEQAINEAILHHGLNLLGPSDGYIDFTGASSTLMASSSLAFDSRHSTVTNSPALQRIFTPTSDSSFSAASSSGPILPSPNSTLSETILHLARAPVWYSHFFLTDWSQVPSMATVSSEPESSQADQPIIDENHSQWPLENEDERDKLAEKKPLLLRCSHQIRAMLRRHRWSNTESDQNEAILHHGLNLLGPSDGYIDFTGASSTLMASSSLAFDSRHSTVTNSPALQRIFTPTSDSSFSAASSSGPILPSPNSTLSETILHLARAPVWYSHFFLTDWSQVPSMATVSSEPESSQADQPIIDENHSQWPLENEDERDKLAEKKPKSRCIVPPPAPSNNELNDVLLNFVQHVRSSTAPMCDASSTQRPSETSIPVSTSEPSSFQSPCSKSAPTPPPEDTERGFLRCLLCSYKTNHPDHLTRHLSGSRNTVSTKCALCGQSVCVQQPALCAAKAHLLLHLGYYIMCPNCGFTVNNSKPVSLISWFAAYCVSVHHISTPFHIPRSIEQPPPHLAPDAAELCMRLHLRFVCFHFNLLQVFVCSRCQHGRGKAYNTMAHLCQHIFDSHTQRQHVCLWCARQSSNDSTAQSASTGVLRNTPGAESGSAASSTRSSDPIEHDDIHNQPSQNIVDSSSVPLSRFGPRYTTPKDLLAHVKRVHKHVLLFSSPENVMATNGQDALDQLPGDLTHGKQSQLRHSQSVRSIDSVDLTKSTNGELPITNGPTSVSAKSRGPPPDSTESDKATTGQSIHLVPAVDFTYVHSCPDCDEVFENRDTFAQHFRASHFSNCSGVCCYRCFGSCKRLSFDLAEFHEHLVTCPSARDLFVATFAHSRSGTVRSANPDHRSHTGDCASVRGHSHPLCFCLHCGIGARRPGPQPRFSGEDDCSTPKSSVVPGDERSNSEQTPGTPQATDVAIGDTLPTTIKEPVYDARYFPDLHSLHHHESQFHFTPTSSQIACPWCGRRLSCHSTADMRFTMHHLRSHTKKHPFAAWSLERTRKWNRNAKALSHCICGAALLDSPLAVLSHASSHLLLSRPSKLSTTSNRLFLTDAWTPHLRLQSTTDVIGLSPVNDRPLISCISSSSSLRRLHRPSPGAHIPCMVDVYHHLRFAVSPELDHYLDHASLVSDPFVCPLCSSSMTTRWALSEHAFVEHWGLLCFICCLLPPSNTPRGPDKRPSSPTTNHHQPSKETSGAASHGTTDQTNTSSSPTDAMLVCPAPTASLRPPQSAISAVSENASSTGTVNIWEHIYRCMRERSELLQSKQPESTGQSTTTGLRQPGTTVKLDKFGCGAGWCRSQLSSNKINGQSESNTGSFKRCADGNVHEVDPADCILVDSSPEVSPRSERTSVTASESDYTAGSQRSKRRLVIVDNDDQEQQVDRSSLRDATDSPKNDGVLNRTEDLTGNVVVTQPLRTCSTRYSELGNSASKDESGSFLCIICGEQQTLDTWEDHSLSHRNPQMPWNGIQLSDPRRLVLMHRQTKIYKCYICDRRFVTRFGCQRHMTGRHKMAKSRISWDLLTQSPSTAHGSRSPDRQCNTVARKSNLTSLHRCNTQPLPAPPPYPRTSEYAPTLRQPPAVDNSSHSTDAQQPLGSSVAVGAHCSAESAAPPPTESQQQQQQLHYCNVCRIPFMSQLSFSIHLAAAHNASVT
ncbi:hypothetical protein T265_08154 [Opisthorchis viverrini]|uniref:Peptidase A2 domain-containing protein n=1 Tax=Opisthorchis viverrini TaxID=6198 RepID=A0A074ZEL8_OPIVI|nr:hypothetical protein T265_08154 [Opisthorchis viverrini]KER24112.1 hypothetical protein T265_08154 [Opisthorchis viverrini]